MPRYKLTIVPKIVSLDHKTFFLIRIFMAPDLVLCEDQCFHMGYGSLATELFEIPVKCRVLGHPHISLLR